MASASYLQASFLGGEISQSYSGRYDVPGYRISLAKCLNWLPIETGALVRRGGTQFCSTTRGGNPGRNISFDVSGANPIYMEFTNNFLRFRLGPALITTNDAQAIVAISAANPAVVQTTAAVTWATGNTAIFSGLGTNNPLLQNRQFLLTKVDTTHFSLQDAITGANIDGSTLGSFVSGTISRVLELATNYGAGSWAAVRSVQAETQTVLLNGTKPQVLTLTAAPTSVSQPTFSIAPSNFLDGPYYDPYPGSIITNYSAQSGNITLTLGFQAYSSTVSYSAGDFVTSSGQGYKSLVSANLNNTPPNASFWTPVNAGVPVGPNGFTGGDIGRHIRLFSEPNGWSSATTYSTGNVVKFNGAYYQATAGSTGVTPGTDATKWAVVSGAAFAVWTWGRITSVTGIGLISPGSEIGSYTSLSAAFDGNTSKPAASCASQSSSVTTYPQWNSGNNYNTGDKVYYNGNLYQCSQGYQVVNSVQSSVSTGAIWLTSGTYYKAVTGVNSTNNVLPPNLPAPGIWSNLGTGNPSNGTIWSNLGAAQPCTIDTFGGLDEHASPKAIDHVVIYPSSDIGFGTNLPGSFTLNLRANNSVPSSPSNGTLLGSAVIGNTLSAVTISSNSSATWNYIWIEMTATQSSLPLPDNGSHTFTITAYLCQVQFFAANVANGSVITIQLVGPALLYSTAAGVINTWRAGLYSDAAGWPTCGTYAEGRLWLGGVVDNRFDTSMSNALFTFSPTGPDGTVADNNAITETLNAPDVNPILWMLPDLQGVLLGTQKREWLVQPASTATGLSPTNIQANPATHLGCANIEPRRTEHTIIFVQKHQRKILEAFADIFSGKFTAPNLLEKARHLTAATIQEIAYAQELNPTIWARCADGSWFGITYKRDTLMTSQGPTFNAPHRQQLGSGRLVESITVGPSPDGTLDSLMMVTNDPATGVRHVELMTDFLEEVDPQTDAWQLDDAVNPTSFTISNSSPAPYGGLTINGLWHLNGKTVQVFAGGLDCGLTEGGVISDFTVSNGSITVPFGDGLTAGSGEGLFTAAFVNSFVPTIPIVVGFAYNSDGQLLRPNAQPETGARNGPAFGKKRRNHDYAIQVVNTQGLSIGTSFSKLFPVIWQDDTSDRYPDNQLFTGVQSATFDIQDDYSFDGQICWRASRVQPAMITDIGGFIETQDR